MPQNSVGLVSKAFAVFAKDIRVELRTRFAVNAILMFGITTLTVVSLSVGQAGLPPKLLAALFWVILFFSGMSGLAHTFIREEEAGTSLALKLHADPTAVYLGKLFFNLLLLSIMTAIITPLFFMFTDAPTGNLGPFFVILILGVLDLCAATTLVAAIIARAAVKSALFAVLSFPILIPVVLLLVAGTSQILDNQSISESLIYIQGLLALGIVWVTASLLLFRFVWLD